MPILSVLRFRVAVGLDHFAGLDIDGVEDYRAFSVPAGTSLALDLEPPFVGQSAIEIVFASQVSGAHHPHPSLIDAG